jgi:ribonucleoside-diphosphate reductase alpha chain
MSQQAYWLNDDSRTFLSRGYLQDGETAEERIRHIAETAENYLKSNDSGFMAEGFADKFEQYMLNGWISLSSPVWANYGTNRGLPISCNGTYVPDTMSGILHATSEVGMMSKYGAGTSGYFGSIRKRGSDISSGGTSDGPVHFMELFEVVTNVVSQSNVRRGSFAAYLPIDHPNIKEFLEIREEGNSIQKMSMGVCITDDWMISMLDGDKEKRKIWSRIIQKRFETGYPYIFFTDTFNNNAPDVYRDNNIKIHASNLCSEIGLSSDEYNSFVCCLLSLNALHYDEWKNTDLVKVATYFLDTVMGEYITKVKDIPFMRNAYNFAIKQRALGIGTLGWHSYLQSKSIAFESNEAKEINIELHRFISEQSLEASKELATIFGEPELLKGYGRRNTTLMAIAPTTSSSFILGQVSPSIEPLNSNYFVKDLAKGKFTYKNPHLKEVLKNHKKDNSEVWKDILMHGGSVQHLEFLSDHEKKVFKTFGEIPQIEIIIQAAMRQNYIDQSQSLNLMIHPDAPAKDVSQLLIEGWKLGVKSFYYQRSSNPAQTYARELLSCVSCEA